MKNAIVLTALLMTTACTMVPEHQPIARLATITATHKLINEGYSAEKLSTVNSQDKFVSVDSVGAEFDGEVGEVLQEVFTKVSDRSHRGYSHKYPARMFSHDTVDSKLLTQWINETAASRMSSR